MSGSHDQTGPGPENITPGRCYQNDQAKGVVYFGISEYWNDPINEKRVPMPGTEQMVALNGTLPGAIVLSPMNGGKEEFWGHFRPIEGEVNLLIP
jgi:hypothetical protein